MQLCIDVPTVVKCDEENCGYNRERTCHACAITVGGILDHQCDTMFKAKEHTSRAETAGVGACKVASCRHNSDFECHAEGIEVGHALRHANCLTFSEK